MKKIFGIFRGFPGLGRVVSGVSLLETLRDNYGCDIEIFSYLQGKLYLEKKGYKIKQDVLPMDFCSIGLLPTHVTGAYIHERIRSFRPDAVLVDGEPLIIQSLKLSHPNLKIVSLLNPADIDNPQNDQDAMTYFKFLYSLSDMSIVHGLRKVELRNSQCNILSTSTILRQEIFGIKNKPSNNIYCALGGGTVNVGYSFAESTIQIAKLCIESAKYLSNYKMHIVCSSRNIYNALMELKSADNVVLHDQILDVQDFYSNAGIIITRSGRNTLSELAYLGIPSVSFLSGCQYRMQEQKQNIKALNVKNIMPIEISTRPDAFAQVLSDMMGKQYNKNEFVAGNSAAIDVILRLLYS